MEKGEEVTTPEVTEVEEESQTVLQFRRSYVKPAMIILLNQPHLEFFGYLLYGIDINILPNEGPHIAYTDEGPHIAYTDGKSITVSVNNIVNSPQLMCGLLSHELLHIMMFHVQRCFDRDRYIWNLATDHTVNRLIRMLERSKGGIKLPDGHVFFEEINESFPNASADEVYEYIMKNYTIKISCEICQDGDGEGSGGSYVTVDVTPKGGGNKRQFKFPIDCNQPMESADVTENCKKVHDDSKMIWNSSSTLRGMMPGNFSSEFEKMFKVEIPWHEIYERCLLFYTQDGCRRRWTTPDFYLPHSMKSCGADRIGETPSTAVFVIDSSGSVGDNDLKKFLSICADSVAYFKSIHILVHDHEIQQEFYFKDPPNNEYIFDEIRKVKGRGGTSHQAVFARIDELVDTNELSVVVFLTDYESDVQQWYPKYQWFEETPSIWILNYKNERCSFESKYDTKIILMKGND